MCSQLAHDHLLFLPKTRSVDMELLFAYYVGLSKENYGQESV